MDKILGINKNVFWLGLVSFFNDASNQMVQAVMPAFLTLVLGATPAFVGFLDGFADAVAAVLRIFSGWWSDRVGKRKQVTVFGYTLSVLTRWFLVIVTSFWNVFTLRVIDRVGKGVRESPRDALVTESVSNGELGRSFGFQRALDAAGGVAGPLLALAILPAVGGDYRMLFAIASAVGLLVLFSFIFVKDVKKPADIISQKLIKLSFSLNGFSREFKLFLTAIFIFGLGFMPIALVTLKAEAEGLHAIGIVAMYMVYTVSYSIFSVPFGKLSDRMSKKALIQYGFTVAAASYVLLAVSTSLISIGIGFLLLGVYSAITDGIERAFASTLLLPAQMASGHGFLQATVGIASLIAGTIGGVIWTQYGPLYAFAGGALLMLAGFLFLIFVDKRRNAVQ